MRLFFEQCFKGLAFFFLRKRYRTFLWLLIRLGGKKRYKAIKTKVGSYKMHLPDALSFIWQYHGIFYKEIYQFKTQQKTPIIFDCGANVGSSCLYFKELYPDSKVVAYEPDPRIFKYLKENIENNQIEGVELKQEATWIEETTLNFGTEGADAGSIYNKDQQSIEVKAIRLRNAIEAYEHIDLLKMDIEGAEVAVIKDCSQSLGHIDHIFIEYHSFLNQPQELQDILTILTESGFRYYVESEMDRKQPLIPKDDFYMNMDNQVNIFAYKASS